MRRDMVAGGAATAPAPGAMRGAFTADGSWDPRPEWDDSWDEARKRASGYPRRRMRFFRRLLAFRRASGASPAELAAMIDVQRAEFAPAYPGERNPAEMFSEATLDAWAKLDRFGEWPVAPVARPAESCLKYEGWPAEGREWRGGRWAPRGALDQPGPPPAEADPW